MIDHYHNNWWYNLNYKLYHQWIYNLQNKWFTISARHGLFIVRVYALGRGFFFLIKCICIVEFCLSFYFSYHLQFSTLKCRILLNFVESFVHCIQYIFHSVLHTIYITLCSLYTIYIILYIAYNIIPLLKCIQYFFLYLLDKVHFICFTNFISNTYIPLFVNYKHIKKYFFIFFLTYALKCAFLYTYLYPFVKH